MTTLAIWLSAYHHDLIGQAGVPAGVSATFLFSLLSPMLLVVLLSLLIAVALMSRHLVARVIGAVGLALFGLAVIQYAQAYDLARVLKPALDPMSAIDRSPLPEPAQATARLPDIIYIVPDRYANSGVLASVFQHDNSGFLDELRRRGTQSGFERLALALPANEWFHMLYMSPKRTCVKEFWRHMLYYIPPKLCSWSHLWRG